MLFRSVNPVLHTFTQIDDQLDVVLRNVVGYGAEYGIQDDREVNDVAHDATDILLPDRDMV